MLNNLYLNSQLKIFRILRALTEKHCKLPTLNFKSVVSENFRQAETKFWNLFVFLKRRTPETSAYAISKFGKQKRICTKLSISGKQNIIRYVLFVFFVNLLLIRWYCCVHIKENSIIKQTDILMLITIFLLTYLGDYWAWIYIK